MKIKANDLLSIQRIVGARLKDNPYMVYKYERGEFVRSECVNDLQKRFCYDLVAGKEFTALCCDTLYDYLDDTHIYTALKKLCPTVTRNY